MHFSQAPLAYALSRIEIQQLGTRKNVLLQALTSQHPRPLSSSDITAESFRVVAADL